LNTDYSSGWCSSTNT